MSKLVSNSFTVTIQFFGAFRNFANDFGNTNHVEIHCEHPCSITQIRIAVKKLLQDRCPLFNESLLEHSVFANENSILPETTQVDHAMQLMILPPISGG